MRAFFILCLALACAPAWSLRPGIPRVTWSTDHFSLTIDEKKQDLLPRLGSLAEECYAKEKAFFGYEPPGKIQMVFLDEQDYANGYAYAPQEWVVIYMHGAEHQLRGTTRWLPGVLSHEIGHIFTLRKMGEDSRFLGFEAFHDWNGNSGSEFQEGFDWAYGRTPPWLAEGLAQFAAGICGYDTLDTHRQMVLRVAASSGALMTPAELKGFAWDSRRNEMLYTQGYALVSYLYKTYGPMAANHYLALAASKGWRSAFKPAFGKSLEGIYADWRKGLESRSHPEDAAGDGDYLLPESPGIYGVESFPTPLAQGRMLYLSARDNDYGSTDLFLNDGKGGNTRLFRNVSSVQAAADGRSALFTATRYAFLQSEPISELYRYDAESGAIDQLTHGGRVIRGCESRGIAYAISNTEGRTSVIRIANGEFTTVFSPPDSIELTDVVPGGEPGTLTVVGTSGFGGDIYELDLASRELSPLANSPQDERDPHWSAGTLYFSADYAGTFDIYALAEGQVTRITHVTGGAFHPFPAGDNVLFSAYGWKGFRLARAKPLGEAAPPFVVELPVPAWKPPQPAEYEGDTWDHTTLGFLGYNITLGAIRSPGYLDSSFDTATGKPHAFSYRPGSKAVAAVAAYLENPSGVASARFKLGWSAPIDYQGPNHLDETAFELRVNAFLPTIVAGGTWYAYDLPDAKSDSIRFQSYQSEGSGYAGLDLRLAENWYASARGLIEEDFSYSESRQYGKQESNSDPQYGGSLDLDYANLDQGKDGVVRGFSAYVDGALPPKLNGNVPDYTVNGGATMYASAHRILFGYASLFHSEDWGKVAKGWVYGGVSAYCAVPLGMQLGTRGGAGLFLDQAYPGVSYLGMSRQALDNGASRPTAWAGGRVPSGAFPSQGEWSRALPVGGNALKPQGRAFYEMFQRATSQEVGFSLSLKTLTFFANPEYWTAGLHFDAADFGREPVWNVMLTL